MYPIQYMHARAGGATNYVVRKHFSRAVNIATTTLGFDD
jgi:hypothetical protein